MYPNTLSVGLSKMLDIWRKGVSVLECIELTLYSKFCAATRGFNSAFHALPFMALISPHAPPTLELWSKAFQRWYIDFPPGRVPTSSKTHTFGFRRGEKALKNQRWLLSFLAFFSFRQNKTCTGTMPFSAP